MSSSLFARWSHSLRLTRLPRPRLNVMAAASAARRCHGDDAMTSRVTLSFQNGAEREPKLCIRPLAASDLRQPASHNSTSATAADNTSDIYWRDRFYPTRHVTPHDIRFTDGSVVNVDYATLPEVTSWLPQMAAQAAARGDNVGVDEYTGPGCLELPTEHSEIFAVRWKKPPSGGAVSSLLAALIVVEPALRYVGTFDPRTAAVYIFRSRDVPDSAYGVLLRETVRVTSSLDVDYTDCVTSVAACCDGLLAAAVKEGFVEAVRFPGSVNMATVGLTDGVLMTLRFNSEPRQSRTPDQISAVVARSRRSSSSASKEPTPSPIIDPPSFPFLPSQYRLQCGRTVTIRQLRGAEIPFVYALFRSAIDEGDGFGLFEFPDEEHFEQVVHDDWLTAGFEDTADRKLIAVFAIEKTSKCVRVPSGYFGEGLIMIDKNFQGVGVGGDIALMGLAMAKELGYRGVFNMYFANNPRAKKMYERLRWKEIGGLRQASYLQRVGWQDLFYTYFDLKQDDIKTFTQLCQEKNSATDDSANNRSKL